METFFNHTAVASAGIVKVNAFYRQKAQTRARARTGLSPFFSMQRVWIMEWGSTFGLDDNYTPRGWAFGGTKWGFIVIGGGVFLRYVVG